MTLFPASIRTVALVSPAGRCDAATLADALALLRNSGVKVKEMPRLNCAGGVSYLAGAPRSRAEDLMRAWRDPEVDLVLSLRGGFGSAQILPFLDWDLMRSRNLPLGGYSDITALHWAMIRQKVGTPVAMPMASGLSHEIPVGPERLTPLSGRACAGNPLPGNLTVAASLCGTAYFPDTTGRILILEDVNEPAYKLDRMLTQLEQAGAFEAVSGVVFGAFSDCPGAAPLLRRFARRVSCPVWSNFPFGHALPFQPISTEKYLQIDENGAYSLT